MNRQTPSRIAGSCQELYSSVQELFDHPRQHGQPRPESMMLLLFTGQAIIVDGGQYRIG
jgi:hypothetical protein